MTYYAIIALPSVIQFLTIHNTIQFSFNPGPFNIKEHVLITVMANVVYGGAYATEVIAAQRVFYNQKPTIPYQILLGMLLYASPRDCWYTS